MEIYCLVVGDWKANCYALVSGGEVMVVDPGDEPERILEWLGDANVTQIFLTHCHCDHIGAVNELVERYGAKVMIGVDDECGLTDLHLSGFDDEGRDYKVEHVDRLLHDGDIVEFGEETFEVLHTPGHTPGSLCLYSRERGLMLSGDTLFNNGIGATHYVRGDAVALRSSIIRLGQLPDCVEVLPGHGPSTTVGREKERNPWLHG